MKKLMLVAALLVAGGSVSFAQDTMGNDNGYSNDHRYGSQINSGCRSGNHNSGGHRNNGNGYNNGNNGHRNNGHRNNNY